MTARFTWRRPAVLAALSAALFTTSVTACAGTGAAAAKATPGPPQTSATPFAGLSSVGVLIADGDHWCTASVIDSPKGNVVATAAHCVYFHGDDVEDGYESGPYEGTLEFAPRFTGAKKGTYPLGKWKVSGIHVDDRWAKENEDDADYAFLTVEPDERGRSLQQVVGAATPDWDSSFERDVTVIGYPNEDHNPDNRPISCTTRTRQDAKESYMLRMDCAGFWGGTSGSPWLADHGGPEEPGRLIGVLSGGDTDTESVAVRFDKRARALYDRVVKGES